MGAPSRGDVQVPEPTEKALAYRRIRQRHLGRQHDLGPARARRASCGPDSPARMRDWAARIGRKWFFVVAAYWVIFTLVSTVDRPAARLLRGLRAPARLRPVEPDHRQVGQRPGGEPRRHAGDRRAGAVDPLSAARPQPAALVALHGDAGRARSSSCCS